MNLGAVDRWQTDVLIGGRETMVLAVMGALALVWIAVVVRVAARYDGGPWVGAWYWTEQRVIGIERVLGRW